MDSRCPRKLKCFPDSWCPLAVLRLKAIRNSGRELSEEEEASLPGCPWSVNHQLANYCFFKYITEYTNDKPPSDLEIASLNAISLETVKKTERSAISKLKNSEEFSSIKKEHGSDAVVEELQVDPDYVILK